MASFEEDKRYRTRTLHDDPSLLQFINHAITSSGATPSEGLQLTYLDKIIDYIDAFSNSQIRLTSGDAPADEYEQFRAFAEIDSPFIEGFLRRRGGIDNPVAWRTVLIEQWQRNLDVRYAFDLDPKYANLS